MKNEISLYIHYFLFNKLFFNFLSLFLRNERRLFERYQKSIRSMPDKKEREEIEALKLQVRNTFIREDELLDVKEIQCLMNACFF